MLQDVKNLLENELLEKRRRTESLFEQISALKDDYNKLFEKQESTRSLIVSKKFSFFEKYFTKRKEYKEYINLCGNQEEDATKLVDIDKKINSLKESIKKNESIPVFEDVKEEELIKSYEQEIENIHNAKSLDGLGMDYSSAKKLLENNEIEPKFDDDREALTLEPEKFATDIDFMKNAIEKDKNLIVFDRTNNKELYIDYLSKIKESVLKSKEKDVNGIYTFAIEAGVNNINSIINEIENPKAQKEGKYKIPHEFIYEAIRTIASKDGTDENISQFQYDIFGDSIDDFEKFINISNQLQTYMSVDSTISQELGDELEKLWKAPDKVFTIHNILRNHRNYNMEENELNVKSKDIIDSIFKKGLKATNAMDELEKDGGPMLSATSFRKGQGLTFIDVINYDYAGGMYNIVMSIPKDAFAKDSKTPIWGTNQERDVANSEREFYLLPEYVYGCFKSKDRNATMIKNDIKDKVKYKYVTYDRDTNKQYELLENNVERKDIEI